MRLPFRPIAVLAVLTIAAASQAWNAIGHMVIAAIAYKNLTPNVKAECDRLLKVNPDERATDFVSTGPWADDVRNQRRETGPWHYIDFHFRADGKSAAGKPDAENVVWAINKFSAILKDQSKPDADRAEALRFLIHFVGDIHQPLHATARETDEHPTGDKGGNDFHIEAPDSFGNQNRGPRNLHSLWDSGAGLLTADARRPLTADGTAKVETLASEIASKQPEKSFKAAHDLNPEHWAQESFGFDKSFVYSLPENSKPTDEYIKKAEDIASQRVALAGYRLANLLNDLLK